MTSIHVDRVLVPIANPANAAELVKLALHLINPDTGRIYVLCVTTQNQENTHQMIQNIYAALEDFPKPQLHVVERMAISPARGILDAIRELNIDLAVLGFQTSPGKTLSPVIEDVAEVAPCHLLIYRSLEHYEIKRVLVPVRASSHSRVAAQQGYSLAQSYGVPMTALHVESDPLLLQTGSAEIQRALSGLSEADRNQVEKAVVHGAHVVDEIVAHADSSTLVVLGFTEGSRADHWLFGEIPQAVLTRFHGPVVLVKRAIGQESAWQRSVRFLKRLSPIMTVDEQTEMMQSAQEMARFNTNYVMLVILSAMLASFGLLQNNPTVIIGAMLVAPLMSPLMGFGLGMAQAKPVLMRRSLMTVLLGVALALLISILIGLLTPLKIPTQEMLGRGQPTLLDMGVALASGIVAAFALGRKDIPAAIAGVAIAAALMPPVCTTGLALAFGDVELFTGAGLLFTLNLVSISIAAFGTFVWMGLQVPSRRALWNPSLLAFVALGLLAIPMTLALSEVNTQTRQRVTIQNTLEEQLNNWDIVEIEIERGNPFTVVATVRGENILLRNDITRTEAALERELDHDVTLAIVLLRLFTPPEETPTPTPEPSHQG